MNNSKFSSISISAILLFSLSANLHAQNIEIQSAKTIEHEQKKEGQEKKYLAKFAQYGENELFAEYTRSPDTTQHFDVSLGFRYLLTNSIMPDGDDIEYAVAIAYQGDFDFFAGSRNSGPVVTTRHNPSLFVNFYRNPKFNEITSVGLSFEHESNGQANNEVIDLDEAKKSFARDYEGDTSVSDAEIEEMALQTISRANNFVALSANYQSRQLSDADCNALFRCINYMLKLRQQLSTDLEDDIWWKPSSQNEQLKKYVGTHLKVNTQFNLLNIKQGLQLDLRTGQLDGGSPFSNNTIDIRYFIDVPIGRFLSTYTDWFDNKGFAIPVVIKYHNGYLEELYKYSDKTSFWAIGLHAKY